VETLRRHPRFDLDFAEKMTDDVLRADKATQDRWIFQHAWTWPDISRGLPDGERARYDRLTRHYVNFPIFVDMSDRDALTGKLTANIATDRPTSIPVRDYNVLQAIGYSRRVIQSRDASPSYKALAYSWLFHLVGDLHQPLHAVSLYSVDQFPAGDRGGSVIPLRRGRDLHSLWDGLLGGRDLLRDVDREVVQLSNRQRYGDVWDVAAKETDPSKWGDESRDLCESFLYNQTILGAVRQTSPGMELTPIELPDQYMKQAGEHARRRIITAGVRLGSLLKREARQLNYSQRN
jgi:hypothetical protein